MCTLVCLHLSFVCVCVCATQKVYSALILVFMLMAYVVLFVGRIVGVTVECDAHPIEQ